MLCSKMHILVDLCVPCLTETMDVRTRQKETYRKKTEEGKQRKTEDVQQNEGEDKTLAACLLYLPFHHV